MITKDKILDALQDEVNYFMEQSQRCLERGEGKGQSDHYKSMARGCQYCMIAIEDLFKQGEQ